MRQEQFERQHRAQWRDFDQWIAMNGRARRGRNRPHLPFAVTEFPARFRSLCGQLALTRSRDYGPAVVDRLHRLARGGHDLLHGGDPGWTRRALRWVHGGFAREVRRQWRHVAAAAALFVLPWIALMIAVRLWPAFAWVVLPGELLASFDTMYGPGAETLGRTRGAAADIEMFGFYIMNNVGIGFRTYASGLLAGVGSAIALVSNAVYFGVVEAHVANLGHAERFYSFVMGHSSFELTAIVLCGAGGLLLGTALLAPGPRSRAAALRAAGRAGVSIVGGAGLMLVVAAAIEAFWSPRQLDFTVKLAVGIFNWLLVIGWLALAGRDDAP